MEIVPSCTVAPVDDGMGVPWTVVGVDVVGKVVCNVVGLGVLAGKVVCGAVRRDAVVVGLNCRAVEFVCGGLLVTVASVVCFSRYRDVGIGLRRRTGFRLHVLTGCR